MIVEEPVRGSFAYLEQTGLFAVPAVDQLRLFIERRQPAPPLTHLSGLVVEEASEGATTWSMPASPWWQSAAGVFPGGTLAFVADAALAGAVYTELPTGTALASSDLSMNFLEPAGPASERLVAKGTIIDVGRRQALSEARVEDARGMLLAHATSRCVLRPLPFEPPGPPEEWPPVEAPSFDTPDPYLRPVEGEVIPQAVWDKTSGLDLVQLWQKGELPASPNCSLLGLRFVDAAEGNVTLAMPASLWFCTGFGTFYGGVLSALTDAAINTAVTTTLPPGTSFATLDLKVNFLRPVAPDGRDLVVRATVEQRGRTIAVSTARIDDADGRRVAMATGSAMISEGPRFRPRALLSPILMNRGMRDIRCRQPRLALQFRIAPWGSLAASSRFPAGSSWRSLSPSRRWRPRPSSASSSPARSRSSSAGLSRHRDGSRCGRSSRPPSPAREVAEPGTMMGDGTRAP